MNVVNALLMVAVLGIAPQQAQWTTNQYGDALEAARESERPMLVLLENPGDKDNKFTDIWDEKLSPLLDKFVVCRVDVSTDYGKKVAEVYDATSTPYSVITDKTCRRIVFRGLGEFPAESWRRTLEFYGGDLAVPNIQPHTEFSATAESEKPSPPNAATAKDSGTAELKRKPFTHKTLADARKKATDNGRLMLVYITMPACKYCDKMKTETFGDPGISQQIATNFESVMVDLKDQPDWVASRNIRVYPTTLIMTANGETLSKIEGFVTPEKLSNRLLLGSDLLSRN